MHSSIIVDNRKVIVKGASIVGVVACVPSKIIKNEDFQDRFTESEISDVIKIIGVNQRRWVDEEVTAGDLCLSAAKKILIDLSWHESSIDAIIFVSQTPDFRLPATAYSLQTRLGLPNSCIAFDINLGCSGYPYALWLGMMLIQTGAAQRVLLAVGDTISKLVDKNDRSTALLFGDAGTITALETDQNNSESFFIFGADGTGANNLIVPQGGFKNKTLISDDRLLGKNRSCLFMDGGEIFNFTLKTIPSLALELLLFSQKITNDYNSFAFHQANLFMLRHLIKKLKLPADKVPLNIQNFGNTSCASIPLLMATNLSDVLKVKSNLLAMFGFGVGYSWAAASVNIPPLKSACLIEL